MLALKLNETDSITCINCWAECSTRIFQRIAKEWNPKPERDLQDRVHLFAILTGLNIDFVLSSTDEELDTAVYQCTAFVDVEPRTFMEEKVDVIKLRGKLISVPKKLASLTVQQNMHIRQAIAQTARLEELISLACAVYMQPLVDGGKYNHERALELEKEIQELPIWQTYSVGFFYLSKLKNSGKLGLLDFNQLTQKIVGSIKQLLSTRKLKDLSHLRGSQ